MAEVYQASQMAALGTLRPIVTPVNGRQLTEPKQPFVEP